MGNRRSLPRLLLGRTHSRPLVGRGMSAVSEVVLALFLLLAIFVSFYFLFGWVA